MRHRRTENKNIHYLCIVKNKHKRMNNFGKGLILLLLSLIVPTIVIVRSVKFDQQCAGYLKQAADANTVELALDRVDMALKYIEDHGLTSGYTSVLWRTEDENIGYWYQNIKACREELANNVDASSLEKSNVLMKVRESLTDDGKEGVELTVPPGISRYPYNLRFGVLRWFSVILCLIAIGIMKM